MTVSVVHGDCLQVMRGMDEASVDAIVTDPPYGLGFMGKAWDDLPPGVEWATECLRVLKPGGYLLAFGGTRTWHRLAVAVEDAGFEIRDSIAWLYGSGFPKSLDVAKAIDKAGGATRVESVAARELAKAITTARTSAGVTRQEMASWFPYREVTKNWERVDAGNRIPSTADYEVLVDRLGLPDRWRDLVADADLRSAEGGGVDRRGDGTVYELALSGQTYGATTADAERWRGWGTALKPAFEPIVVARKPLVGSVVVNVLQYGTSALNIDAARVGEASGRWPANVVLDETQAHALDQQSGVLHSQDPATRASKSKRIGVTEMGTGSSIEYADKGGASRFFYVAKAPKKERPTVDGIAHPTVKPLALMRWLVRLVTSPGGTVLDPFAGSGTTVEAAILEGFSVIGIERDAEYLPLIDARITRNDPTLDLSDGGAA